MTSMELSTALGGISAEALSGMEELQMNTPAPLPHRKPIARGLLIAAMISLLLLLSGCCLYVITRNLTGTGSAALQRSHRHRMYVQELDA